MDHEIQAKQRSKTQSGFYRKKKKQPHFLTSRNSDFTRNNKEVNDLEQQVQLVVKGWESFTEGKVLSITMVVNNMGEVQMDFEIECFKEL